MKLKTLVKANWNKTHLTEIVQTPSLRRFRIVTGLRNGNDSSTVSILGDNGWSFLVGNNDLDYAGLKSRNNDASYVSQELTRRKFAEDVNKEFKKTILKIFIDEK